MIRSPHSVAFGLMASLLLLLASCSDTFKSSDAGGGDGPQVWPDTSFNVCQPGKDSDQDGIPDEVEGCETDTDKDGSKDLADADSDNDGIPDAIEAGPNPKTPLDTDKDGIPDFQDDDSDNDGIKDGDEDLNGDGLLGCCLLTCNEKREGCPLNAEGCGDGQKCEGGKCTPAVDFLCSNGETSPGAATTFPGSGPDTSLPNFICHKPGETSDKGLKPMQFKKSSDGGWHLALEKDSTYGDAVIANVKAKEAAATFDLMGTSQAVAGFIVSVPTTETDATKLAADFATTISTQLPGKASVSQVVSGSPKTSHDGFATVVGTQLAITMSAGQNPPTLRNALVPLLLGRPAADVTQLPAPNFGPSDKEHVLLYQTLVRPKEGRVLVMGAVAAASWAKDNAKDTGFHLDDLSNGTGLATLQDTDTVECDPFVLESTPIADILWIVDESGSMSDNRQDIVNNATDFFNRATKSGLDFRMGVAGMKKIGSSEITGKLCSTASTDKYHDGGTDRFLQPTEQTIFEACVKNPPYYEGGTEYGLAHTFEAVTRHLPRQPAAANDLTKVRQEAVLVIIIATDEAPYELKSYGSYNGQSGFLSSSDWAIDNCTTSKQGQIDSYVKPWVDLYTGKNATYGAEGKAIVHLIAGTCQTPCGTYGPEIPWGYQEIVKATGGQKADICQKNLGTTLQLIIDSITGAASPAVLQYIPISASLAVALGQNQLQRSRTKGFDYSAASNSLRFIGVPFQKGDQVVASYRRWVDQGTVIE